MELTMKRSDNKIIAVVLFAVCLMFLIPSVIVFANAITSQPEIGFVGLTNAEKTIGMVGTNNSSIVIDFGTSGNLNPQSPAFQLASIIPLVFLGIALIMIMRQMFTERITLQTIVITAVIIMVAVALLIGM